MLSRFLRALCLATLMFCVWALITYGDPYSLFYSVVMDIKEFVPWSLLYPGLHFVALIFIPMFIVMVVRIVSIIFNSIMERSLEKAETKTVEQEQALIQQESRCLLEHLSDDEQEAYFLCEPGRDKDFWVVLSRLHAVHNSYLNAGERKTMDAVMEKVLTDIKPDLRVLNHDPLWESLNKLESVFTQHFSHQETETHELNVFLQRFYSELKISQKKIKEQDELDQKFEQTEQEYWSWKAEYAELTELWEPLRDFEAALLSGEKSKSWIIHEFSRLKKITESVLTVFLIITRPEYVVDRKLRKEIGAYQNVDRIEVWNENAYVGNINEEVVFYPNHGKEQVEFDGTKLTLRKTEKGFTKLDVKPSPFPVMIGKSLNHAIQNRRKRKVKS